MSLPKAIISMCLMTAFFSSMVMATTIFPHGCEVTGFGFNENYLILNETGNQSYYLIQNHSTMPVELQRYETREVFMSPPLTAKLNPTNWAAFASDEQNLHFECLVNENETNKQIDCREVLDVCQYPRVKFALSNMGNYWVSINKTQPQVINESTNKGIYLHW